MKNVLLLSLMFLFSGCSCLLSQIPPQRIYATNDCSAPIPNYLQKVTATDNCEIVSLIQSPVAGTMLTPTNKVANVTITARDASGNTQQLTFTVTLLDTIKPKFIVAPDLMALSVEQIGDIYNHADKLIEYQLAVMDKQVADTTVFPESQFPNLRNVYEDSTYYKRMMLTWTSPGHAITGYGSRVWTFPNVGDTLIIR